MAITWRDIPGHFDFHDIYEQAVAEASNGARFVEVGVLLGRSTAYMCDAIRRSGKRICFDAVDTWEETFGHLVPRFERMPIAQKRAYGLPDWPEGYWRELFRTCGCPAGSEYSPLSTWLMAQHLLRASGSLDFVRLHRGRGQELAATFADGILDFVFIDAAHSLSDTESLLQAYLPKLRPGGVLAGHDFTPKFPGVVEAVRRVLPGVDRVGNSFVKRV